MKKLGILIILLICAAAALLLSGCDIGGTIQQMGIGENADNVKVGTGGTDDNTNYSAPKVIESDELVLFQTGFYRNGDYVYDKDRSYYFMMTLSEDGVYTISEGRDEKLKCETDKAFAESLQQLIKENDLIKLNGINKRTYGLPPEFDPYWINAEYASKEVLNFSMNGDPDAKWTGDIIDLFAKEFGKHGIEDLLPAKETSAMTRFSLEFAYDDICYRYSEIMVPVTEEEKARSFEDIATNGRNEEECVIMAYADPWDRTGKTETDERRMADITPEHYEALQEIADEYELFRYQNGQLLPSGFDYENTPEFYEFYIEYESGKRMSGFSDDPGQCEKFKPIAESFAAYYEDYIERNADNGD